MTIKTVLVGARGYVGSELISILSQHASIELIAASSRELEGKTVQQYTKSKLTYGNLTPEDVAELSADLVILSLPNGLASQFVESLEQKRGDTTIIDLSADYRFKEGWSYSLPEIYQPQTMTRISNPGCYATAMQLSIAPVKHLVQGRVSCFGISGYSGAGTTPSDKNNTELLNNNVMPYSLANHLHEKEVSHHLSMDIKFSPHVAEYFRGITLTSHIPLKRPLSLTDIKSCYEDFYQKSTLIKVQEPPPQIRQVSNTFDTIIGGFELSPDGQHLAVSCALDNLLKGAASQAVQNINIAFELPQLEGLKQGR